MTSVIGGKCIPPSPVEVAVGEREGAAAAAVGGVGIISRVPGLGGNGSGIGGSGTINGSRTPKHMASCFEMLNDAFAHCECASFVPMATFRIGIIFGHNRW